MNRESWLAERRKGIGASDAPIIMGVSPWTTPIELWAEKMGHGPARDMNEYMRWGLRLEPVIASAYEEETGRAVYQPDSVVRHAELEWMLSTLDRCVDGEDRIVELKTASSDMGWGEPGTDEVPDHILIQVEHQLATTGWQIADVAVLIGGSDFRIYTVHRNEPLIQAIIAKEKSFYRCMQSKTPPTDEIADPKLYDMIYPPVAGELVSLPSEAAIVAEKYTLGAKQAEFGEQLKRFAKSQLLHWMGNASVGVLPDGREVTRTVTKRKGYEVQPCEYVDFRIKTNRGNKGNGRDALELLTDERGNE